MITVPVELGERSYTIEIGTGNLAGVAHFLSQRCRTRHAIVITDEHVQQPWASSVAESFGADGLTVDLVVVEPGEATKSVETASELWEKFAELSAHRRSVVVAVGGGVVGDLAGFVAATYARGVPLLQIPTTLLAQVDSSVGGKVGVNLPQAKNMVGAFWQPLGVLIDTAVLETLPPRDYRAGLAEVVKYGVILDAEFFAYLEANVKALIERQGDVLRQVIARSCELKAQVVSRDEREETGLRAVLNYGHTFGHGFETLTGYASLLHGEAVAMGMLCASRLAERLGRVDAACTRRQRDLLGQLGLPLVPPSGLDPAAVLAVMGRDKKVEQGKLRFVLPTRLGHAELVEGVPIEIVADVLRE
ncbi:MAG TPA: 3-dehydroquinate synthase [Pirellulales bacterium]|nr:3-dehydroquinate synthase [Pirellulales bacterium]